MKTVLVVSELDRSGADALRDLTRTLPIVIFVTLLGGAPLAFVLARSIAWPLERLGVRTSPLLDPTAPTGDPLALSGPREVRELTQRVNVLADELGRTRARESELLADLQHDLRTPLTVIGGCAAALADGTATGEAADRATAAIAEEAERLERLVGELGAIDRLRSGSDTLRLEPVAAEAVLGATVERFAAAAAGAAVSLSASPPQTDAAELSRALVADRVALDRILGNLVDNALAVARRAARSGSIRLEARRVNDVAGVAGPAIAFSVVDDGPGFPPGGTGSSLRAVLPGRPRPIRTGERARPGDRGRAGECPRRDRDRREPQPARGPGQRDPADPPAGWALISARTARRRSRTRPRAGRRG